MGEASALDVLNLFKIVRREVYEKTGMELKNEPAFVGFSEEELEDAYSLN
jgi:UDP-N-acetylenolpyruvoylglucosamine reductase